MLPILLLVDCYNLWWPPFWLLILSMSHMQSSHPFIMSICLQSTTAMHQSTVAWPMIEVQIPEFCCLLFLFCIFVFYSTIFFQDKRLIYYFLGAQFHTQISVPGSYKVHNVSDMPYVQLTFGCIHFNWLIYFIYDKSIIFFALLFWQIKLIESINSSFNNMLIAMSCNHEI